MASIHVLLGNDTLPGLTDQWVHWEVWLTPGGDLIALESVVLTVYTTVVARKPVLFVFILWLALEEVLIQRDNLYHQQII